MGIYKRNKKVWKQDNKKTRTRPRKWSRKKKVFLFFSWSSSCFLSYSHVFLVEFLFPCFLTFLFSFINSHLRDVGALASFIVKTSIAHFLYTHINALMGQVRFKGMHGKGKGSVMDMFRNYKTITFFALIVWNIKIPV